MCGWEGREPNGERKGAADSEGLWLLVRATRTAFGRPATPTEWCQGEQGLRVCVACGPQGAIWAAKQPFLKQCSGEGTEGRCWQYKLEAACAAVGRPASPTERLRVSRGLKDVGLKGP